jgi:CBS domain-containing protein
MAKVRINTPIQQIMATQVKTVGRHQKISEVARLFTEQPFTHLPVVEGSKLIGIISYNDILRVSFGDSFGTDSREVLAILDKTKTLDHIMTQSPVTITPNETIRDAAKILGENRFHALPVVDKKNGDLVGIVTTTDIMRYLADE